MPARYSRVIISGTIGLASTPAEIFSTGFALANGGSPELVDLLSDADMDDLDSLVTGWFSDGDTLINQRCHLTRVRHVVIGADGLYERTAPGGPFKVKDRVHVTDVPGGRSTARHPSQVANVVSLLTVRPGRSGKGRMYLPCPTSVLDDDYRMPTSDRDACLGRTQTFLQAVNALTEPSSMVVSVAAADGDHYPVASIRVGRVLDTQRRRRNAIGEDFSVAPVLTP